ncbi:MAG: RNA-binding protein [Thermoplasmata archaeon]|nr:MAG: RNA-binding protein [Thermoplasmata archaeon]HDH82033.1 RNA-binding protein [Thermoplasmatales archaeon]MCD6147324.1 exosome complex RNA-binding protein Csl4 [Thermoplasmata archaeon]RLF44603.1 MAG: RNA-binding protein [Thermoplasmata archaeon]RLF63000.1 MAG: RNA-binding protein [Thermoplasmata archaeon]
MIEEGSVVLPGDIIATSEELFPGYGTKDVGGNIIGTIIGNFFINKKRTAAEIKPLTSVPALLHKGDTIICEVKKITDKMVLVDILHVAGVNREMAGDKDAAIRVSDIAAGYVVSARDEYRIGDIIRARVMQARPAMRLSTEGPHLGSIKSFCSNCRVPLVKKNSVLECPRCGRVEKRKIASDYGEGNIDRKVKFVRR